MKSRAPLIPPCLLTVSSLTTLTTAAAAVQVFVGLPSDTFKSHSRRPLLRFPPPPSQSFGAVSRRCPSFPVVLIVLPPTRQSLDSLTHFCLHSGSFYCEFVYSRWVFTPAVIKLMSFFFFDQLSSGSVLEASHYVPD